MAELWSGPLHLRAEFDCLEPRQDAFAPLRSRARHLSSPSFSESSSDTRGSTSIKSRRHSLLVVRTSFRERRLYVACLNLNTPSNRLRFGDPAGEGKLNEDPASENIGEIGPAESLFLSWEGRWNAAWGVGISKFPRSSDNQLSRWRREVRCDSLSPTYNKFVEFLPGGYVVDIADIRGRDQFG